MLCFPCRLLSNKPGANRETSRCNLENILIKPLLMSPLSVHCDVGEWSEWSPCSRAGRTCGFKRGQEMRTRLVLQYPSAFGTPCPEISEIRECVVKRRKCTGKNSNTKVKCVRSPASINNSFWIHHNLKVLGTVAFFCVIWGICKYLKYRNCFSDPIKET